MNHWNQVRTIYDQGIATRTATFETTLPEWEEWDKAHFPIGRLVARANDAVIGLRALCPVLICCCYSGVAEVSTYVAKPCRGQCVGATLLQALVDLTEKHDIWTLQASIFLENIGSLALVKKCGFRKVGRRERLGQLDGVWRDVLLLERRSKATGI